MNHTIKIFSKVLSIINVLTNSHRRPWIIINPRYTMACLQLSRFPSPLATLSKTFAKVVVARVTLTTNILLRGEFFNLFSTKSQRRRPPPPPVLEQRPSQGHSTSSLLVITIFNWELHIHVGFFLILHELVLLKCHEDNWNWGRNNSTELCTCWKEEAKTCLYVRSLSGSCWWHEHVIL